MNNFVALTGVLALAAGVASAANMDMQAAFKKLDTDHDGRISKAEAASDKSLESQFTTADMDKDGYLSAAEFVAIKKETEDKARQ